MGSQKYELGSGPLLERAKIRFRWQSPIGKERSHRIRSVTGSPAKIDKT